LAEQVIGCLGITQPQFRESQTYPRIGIVRAEPLRRFKAFFRIRAGIGPVGSPTGSKDRVGAGRAGSLGDQRHPRKEGSATTDRGPGM